MNKQEENIYFLSDILLADNGVFAETSAHGSAFDIFKRLCATEFGGCPLNVREAFKSFSEDVKAHGTEAFFDFDFAFLSSVLGEYGATLYLSR